MSVPFAHLAGWLEALAFAPAFGALALALVRRRRIGRADGRPRSPLDLQETP